ncbi:MAG TPA: hypothetical protein VGB38_03415 [bacterium]
MLVKNFRISLKNSMFYTPEHPINVFSINNFKTALDKWFTANDKLELGISQSGLFLNGQPVKGKDEWYSEVAGHLHARGLVALSLLKGIETDELARFFGVIRNDRKTIQENGGLFKTFQTSGHIRLKEIDYSSLLTAEARKPESEEEKIWQFLSGIAQQSKGGDLPESKVDFLINFFKDTQHSAKTLNKVYKEAVSHLQDTDKAKEIRESIVQICQYLEKHSSTNAKDLKAQLMNVIAQLNPDLINILFEQTVEDERGYDLAETITKDFSEDYIAEFIESLINSDDSFNENLLKVFDKLTPGPTKSNAVVSAVADKLFAKRIVNPNTLSQLQMSIMEIFKRHPESNFMNQIYKITVDAVMNKKIDTLVYMARLSPLINKFVQSMEEGELKKEKIWLLLNILWLENDPLEFKRFTSKLMSVLPELIDTKDTGRLREIVEFFTEKIRPEQRSNQTLASEIREGLAKITNRETLDAIISLVPESGQKDLEDIVYTLIQSQAHCAKTLVDACLSEKNPAHRNKFRFIFLRMRQEIAREAVSRLEECDPSVVKDLFQILLDCSPQKAHLASKKLIQHKNVEIRWHALEVFEPKNGDEITDVFKIYRKEKNRSIKKKAAAVLLRTHHADTVNRLFAHAGRTRFRFRDMLELVELCGNIRVQEAFAHLQRIYDRRGWFSTKRRDDLRVAAVTAAGRLQTTEAIVLVKRALRDRSKRVREMAEIILQLGE